MARVYHPPPSLAWFTSQRITSRSSLVNGIPVTHDPMISPGWGTLGRCTPGPMTDHTLGGVCSPRSRSYRVEGHFTGGKWDNPFTWSMEHRDRWPQWRRTVRKPIQNLSSGFCGCLAYFSSVRRYVQESLPSSPLIGLHQE